MTDWDRAKPLLEAKLDSAHVQPPKQFGPKGSYIEGWHAIAEANRIFGFDGWSYDVSSLVCVSERPRDIGRDKKPGFGVTYTATVRVTVGDMTGDVLRVDVGAGHGYDVDCGLAHESAIKEAVTDALKRALRTFGNPFGLALYDKSGDNVERGEARQEPAKLSERAAAKAPASPSKLDIFIGHLDSAASLAELQEIWSTHRDLQSNKGAIQAKDRNKARLSQPIILGDRQVPTEADCPF